MRKLKAFTVLELLVAMVISSLVISASYFTYDIIYKQFLNYKKVDKAVLDAITFRNVLNADFAAAKFVYKSGNGIRIVDFDDREYKYSFSKDQIIRKVGAASDAFLLNTSEIKYKELEIASVRSKLLNTLEMSITLNEVKSRISFQKHYGADLIMQLEPDNI